MVPRGEIWHAQPEHSLFFFFLSFFQILKCLVYLIYKDKISEKHCVLFSSLSLKLRVIFSDQLCKGFVLPGSKHTDNRENC